MCKRLLRWGSMSFVENLKREMSRQDISQRELGRRLGIKSQAVTQWVNEKTKPGLNRIVQIASVLGVSPAALLADNHGSGLERSSSRRPNTVGQRFAIIREIVWRDTGAAQQAASDLGLEEAELAAIETDKRKPSLPTILRLCALANCPVSYVTDGLPHGMRPDLVGWIAELAPELLPEDLNSQDVVG